jgi:vancomycin resistance protein YoaR
MAGLGIEERYNHSLPSSYIPVGMDAVVSYPMLDLRIKNTHARPVVLRVHTEDNVLIARFYSDMPQTGRVLFRREVSEEIPYQEVITTDPSLEPGTIRITKRGKVGYKVQRGRIFWENDVERYEKLLMDTYRPQTQHVSIAMDVIYPPPDEPVPSEGVAPVPSDSI